MCFEGLGRLTIDENNHGHDFNFFILIELTHSYAVEIASWILLFEKNPKFFKEM